MRLRSFLGGTYAFEPKGLHHEARVLTLGLDANKKKCINELKLDKSLFNKYSGKNCFTSRVMNDWNNPGNHELFANTLKEKIR